MVGSMNVSPISVAITRAIKAAAFRAAAIKYPDAEAVFREAAAINSAKSKKALDALATRVRSRR
jgi:hypothetical protein